MGEGEYVAGRKGVLEWPMKSSSRLQIDVLHKAGRACVICIHELDHCAQTKIEQVIQQAFWWIVSAIAFGHLPLPQTATLLQVAAFFQALSAPN